MWRNFRFLHIYHAYKSDVSPHDNFISTHIFSDISDKYPVCARPAFQTKSMTYLLYLLTNTEIRKTFGSAD